MTSNVSLPINKLCKRGKKKKKQLSATTKSPEITKSIARHINISVTVQPNEAQFF